MLPALASCEQPFVPLIEVHIGLDILTTSRSFFFHHANTDGLATMSFIFLLNLKLIENTLEQATQGQKLNFVHQQAFTSVFYVDRQQLIRMGTV